MELISLKYASFVFALMVFYYIFPRKNRWFVLFAGSLMYYIIVCKWYVCFILFTIISTYGLARLLQRIQYVQTATIEEHKNEWDKETRKRYKKKMGRKRETVLIIGLICNFSILFFFKYLPFASAMGLLLPLGISFYTFQSMGYLIDVHRESVEPERNLLKFALFVSFFPQIIQGPIAIYDKYAKQLYEGHSFDFERIKCSLLLILWGMIKKLVIADRVVNISRVILQDTSKYSGSMILLAALVYALQLYTDFSGGIDIVRGVGGLFGVELPINFKRPYLSHSLTEYWHRWHMTLGDWCRNYIFYPLSISKWFLNLGKWLKPKFGKHISKVLPGSIASVITFVVIGLWHGANLKYLYFGLWNGLVIMIGELIRPITNRVAGIFYAKFHLKQDGIIEKVVSIIWTFVLVLIGYYFDIAKNATEAFYMLKKTVTDFCIVDWNPHSIIHTLAESQLDIWDYSLALVGCMCILIISIIQEKTEIDYKEYILSRKCTTRWTIIIFGILIVAVLGYYGPGVKPSDFVYMQF